MDMLQLALPLSISLDDLLRERVDATLFVLTAGE